MAISLANNVLLFPLLFLEVYSSKNILIKASPKSTVSGSFYFEKYLLIEEMPTATLFKDNKLDTVLFLCYLDVK